MEGRSGGWGEEEGALPPPHPAPPSIRASVKQIMQKRLVNCPYLASLRKAHVRASD